MRNYRSYKSKRKSSKYDIIKGKIEEPKEHKTWKVMGWMCIVFWLMYFSILVLADSKIINLDALKDIQRFLSIGLISVLIICIIESEN